MIHRVSRISFLLGSLGGALLCGCGGAKDGYQELSGLATFQGERIPEGSIQFFSAGEQAVLCGGAMIRNGEYRVPKEHGLKPGSYLVKISWSERVPNPNKEHSEMNPFIPRERLPAKFNTESTLKVEVRAGQREPFNFDLQ